MRTSCKSCPWDLSDGPEGAVTSKDCVVVRPEEHGEMLATVYAYVDVVGDATALQDVIEELSGYGAHRMRGFVE